MKRLSVLGKDSAEPVMAVVPPTAACRYKSRFRQLLSVRNIYNKYPIYTE